MVKRCSPALETGVLKFDFKWNSNTVLVDSGAWLPRVLSIDAEYNKCTDHMLNALSCLTVVSHGWSSRDSSLELPLSECADDSSGELAMAKMLGVESTIGTAMT